jgi:hypothetical protein
MAAPLFASIGEFFLLRDAEARARSATAAQHARVAAHVEAGDRRARAARRAADPVTAAILYREALLAYARADAASAEDFARAADDLPPDALAARVPAVPPDVVDPAPDDTERVRRALVSRDPLYFDALGDAELARITGAFDRALAPARRRLEPRTVLHLRATRIGRIAGCAFLVTVALAHAVLEHLHPDIAFGKPVRVSSLAAGKPEALVDGDIGTSFAVATMKQDDAWVAVDLRAVHALTRIVVRNRVDGYFDNSLPLALETSTDGAHWDLVARRDTTFAAVPPWSVDLSHKPARFVRVRTLTQADLVLTEIEVYDR